MAPSITLATLGSGAMPEPVTVLLVLAGVVYVMWQRMRGEPLQAKRLLALPLVFTVLGIVELTGSGAPRLHSESLVFLVAGSLLSVVLGAARGATIELFSRQGHLWQRYRGTTIALWGALIASKLVLALVAHLAGAPNTTDLTLSLGLSLAGEAALVAPRALSSGVPFAPDRKQPDRKQPDRRRQGRATGTFAGCRPDATTLRGSRWDDDASMRGSSCDKSRDDAGRWPSPIWHDGLSWVGDRIERSGRDR